MQILNNHHDNLTNNYIADCGRPGDFLIIYSYIDAFLDKWIKNWVYAKKDDNRHLNILLRTVGGTPAELKRIVDFLRDNYDKIDFYVMDYAMSAGTMFCMAADNIYMSNEACLGPIDPQVFIDEKYVPAQAHLKSWKLLTEKEFLSPAEEIMAQKFNPAEMESFKQTSNFSIKLVKGWLKKYKFASWDKSDAEKEERAKDIAEGLDDNEKWQIHSYPLNKKELRELGLKIESIEGELLDRMKALCTLVDDIMGLYKYERFIFLKEQ